MEIRLILSALRKHKTAAALIVLEVALSCAVVCNTMFLVFQRVDLLNKPSGIDEHHLLEIKLGGVGKQVNADSRSLEDLSALRSVPGVDSAVIVNQVPFQNSSWNTSLKNSPDQEVSTLNAAEYMVSPGALKSMGLKLIAGRDFHDNEFKEGAILDSDVSMMSGPVIISVATAEKLFPNTNVNSSIGKTVYMATTPLTIIGVVETLVRPNKNNSNDYDSSLIMPIRLNYDSGGIYLIRVTDPARRNEVLKNAVDALVKIDSNRLVLKQRSYDDHRNDYFADDRDMVSLLVAVSVLQLTITALGIIGLASFWVQQRTRQIGVRRALGATKSQILHYFQIENFILATGGILLGMLLAFAVNQLLMSKYELPRLPWHYLPVGALVLWFVGQIAVLGPARRASAVPPAVATRGAVS